MPNNNSSKVKTKFLFYSLSVFLFTSCAYQTNLHDENKERLPSSALSTQASELLTHSVRYESCRATNSYLEPRLAKMPPEYLVIRHEESQTRLPVQCVQLALRSYVGN